jgi:pimeloyl-ACP methyl ester carboxylesterase
MRFTVKAINISCDNLMMQCSGTVPAKVLLQLTTAFRDGGLRNRAGTFFFKEHLRKIKVPVLALAGDEDLICPPEAVYGMAMSFLMCRFATFKNPECQYRSHCILLFNWG